ncbi:hypothetical protein VNO78_02019 [Psophocarpus tetragonolobus]|uniref:Uncharacterized protein n=1 Tax=Psophocarpus tetragonolobus TaxID=3891 RepID=A0AAN9T287_PSOTE
MDGTPHENGDDSPRVSVLQELELIHQYQKLGEHFVFGGLESLTIVTGIQEEEVPVMSHISAKRSHIMDASDILIINHFSTEAIHNDDGMAEVEWKRVVRCYISFTVMERDMRLHGIRAFKPITRSGFTQ